jgi:carboxymethylenebutenolidase
MPIHDSRRVEFSIDSGYINIVTDEGQQVPAYWAHPRVGNKFSSICLLHDWWGMDTIARLLANFFAQMGYYVIVPDLFRGLTAQTPRQAMELVEKTQSERYPMVNAALSVLETHHRTNRSVAAIGVGMGGTMAFEAAIRRKDLEASIAYGGFPQQYLGKFAQITTPILAIYGSEEPYTKPATITQLREELAASALSERHQVVIIEGAKHDFFAQNPDPALRPISTLAINHTLAFLERYLEKPELRNIR